MTWLMAFGIVVLGLAASPAVIPTSSVPPNENMTSGNARRSPPMPLGNSPPPVHRLLTAAP